MTAGREGRGWPRGLPRAGQVAQGARPAVILDNGQGPGPRPRRPGCHGPVLPRGWLRQLRASWRRFGGAGEEMGPAPRPSTAAVRARHLTESEGQAWPPWLGLWGWPLRHACLWDEDPGCEEGWKGLGCRQGAVRVLLMPSGGQGCCRR